MATSMSVILSVNWQVQCGLWNMRMNKDTLPVLQELTVQKRRQTFIFCVLLILVNFQVQLPEAREDGTITSAWGMSLELGLKVSVDFYQEGKGEGRWCNHQEFGKAFKILQKCERT